MKLEKLKSVSVLISGDEELYRLELIPIYPFDLHEFDLYYSLILNCIE